MPGRAFAVDQEFRIVEIGGGLEIVFERRGEDAIGAKKWDQVARSRVKTMTLPTTLLMQLYEGWRECRFGKRPKARDAKTPELSADGLRMDTRFGGHR